MHNSYDECIQSTSKGYLVLKTTIKFLLASKAHNVAEKVQEQKNFAVIILVKHHEFSLLII